MHHKILCKSYLTIKSYMSYNLGIYLGLLMTHSRGPLKRGVPNFFIFHKEMVDFQIKNFLLHLKALCTMTGIKQKFSVCI